MLTNDDKEWLSKNYPTLAIDQEGKVAGEINFTATYNEETGLFLQIEDDTADDVGGLQLSGRFTIAIAPRTSFQFSRLPALTVEEVDPIADRHFNQPDFSACVCNPLEEDEFLQPDFDFQLYFKKLVIPFLYGQLYFDNHGRWPWFEYAHGGLGTVESFSKNPTLEKAQECIEKISKDVPFWEKARPLLLQEGVIKGGTPCTCKRGDPLRRCHPVALEGLRLLKRVVHENKLPLPEVRPVGNLSSQAS